MTEEERKLLCIAFKAAHKISLLRFVYRGDAGECLHRCEIDELVGAYDRFEKLLGPVYRIDYLKPKQEEKDSRDGTDSTNF